MWVRGWSYESHSGCNGNCCYWVVCSVWGMHSCTLVAMTATVTGLFGLCALEIFGKETVFISETRICLQWGAG